MNYWEIVLWDDEVIPVKPDNVEFVQKKIATGEGAINTKERSITVKNIKDFRETSKLYTDQKLIEGAAQAFNQPIVENGNIVGKWVKKTVTKREYDKYYLAIPAYKKVGGSESRITIAWRQPVHLINYEVVDDLTLEDERKMSKRV